MINGEHWNDEIITTQPNFNTYENASLPTISNKTQHNKGYSTEPIKPFTINWDAVVNDILQGKSAESE